VEAFCEFTCPDGTVQFMYMRMNLVCTQQIIHEKQVQKLKARYRYKPKLLQRHLDELELIRSDRNSGKIPPYFHVSIKCISKAGQTVL
jgi:hypothetical protein